jgi:hypothetical protein
MSEEKKIAEKTVAAPKKRTPKKQGGNSGDTLKVIWHYICMFKGAIISLPVLGVSIWQAFQNASRLPETVGINLLATGDYAQTVSRSVAVVVPLLITIVCILLTSFSKRVLFPWLISIFTLVLPVLIWFTNIYPA